MSWMELSGQYEKNCVFRKNQQKSIDDRFLIIHASFMHQSQQMAVSVKIESVSADQMILMSIAYRLRIDTMPSVEKYGISYLSIS
jgi:hypothetical protein